jgi:hypothetical protein
MQTRIQRYRPFASGARGLICLCLVCSTVVADGQSCRVLQTGKQFELQSPLFVYRLAASDGLRALSWENRLSGHKITLGKGPELEVDLGESPSVPKAVTFEVTKLPSPSAADAMEARFELAANEQGISAAVTYRWNSNEPVLHKFVKITNAGGKATRLLNVRLGTYPTDAKLADREQGFPIYLNDEFFMSLAHPAGWAMSKDGKASLCHFPGAKLAPGAALECMQTVFGVAPQGAARKSFVAHVRSRMRRVVRGHDKPYAIFDNFGSWKGLPGEPETTLWMNSEAFQLHSLRLLAESQKATGCRFDFNSIDFWVDPAGDMKGWIPGRFPNGIKNIKTVLDSLGTAPGLWIGTSTAWANGWSLAQSNPVVQPSLTHDKGDFCRASEPIKSMFRDAFTYHIREEGVRLLKFDEFHTVCNNLKHDHLPGVYSTEAIENSVIEFLHDMDRECPEVFLMLYWGYRSPWWLLHGDTLFDSGIGIEAASPSSLPAPYVRDSVTQKLDQAQWYSRDLPGLGKDSLGIWLSDWEWNSCVGKEHWQEGFVMDICRGSLLAQIWADNDWLSPPESKQLADFIALLRAQPRCFGNPRFILGNPWNDEPYGYCCSDGRRAFLAINNSTWEDRSISLELNSAWGLPNGQRWDLYRWYPEAARLKGNDENFGPKTAIMLKPFEVVLLEVVPAGQQPSLDRALPTQPLLTTFPEASRTVKTTVHDMNAQCEKDAAIWTVLTPRTAISKRGATLTKEADGSILAGGKNPSPDVYTVTADARLKGITGIRLEVLKDPQFPSHGPGRSGNGNFALSEFSVTASPRGNPTDSEWIRLQKASASFSQTSYGGWPAAAAIDGDLKTAWSIDPREGESQTAIFEIEKPTDLAEGGTLTFTLHLAYGEGLADHTLGRFRLSATTAKPPIPRPASRDSQRFAIEADVPASVRGGTFVVTAEIEKEGKAVSFRNVGEYFSGEAKLAGRTVPCQPVIAKHSYPSMWQAWRIAVAAAAKPRTVELSITTSVPNNVQCIFQGHFIPSR